ADTTQFLSVHAIHDARYQSGSLDSVRERGPRGVATVQRPGCGAQNVTSSDPGVSAWLQVTMVSRPRASPISQKRSGSGAPATPSASTRATSPGGAEASRRRVASISCQTRAFGTAVTRSGPPPRSAWATPAIPPDWCQGTSADVAGTAI